MGFKLIINLDMASNIPIYVQLRNEIVMGIGKGQLKKGQGLPSVRQLAEEIGVNMMTVNKAYNILKSEGYIEIDRRHGAKVNPSIDLSKEFKIKLENELSLIIAESGIKGIDYNEFIRMCNDVYKNMQGLNFIKNEV